MTSTQTQPAPALDLASLGVPYAAEHSDAFAVRFLATYRSAGMDEADRRRLQPALDRFRDYLQVGGLLALPTSAEAATRADEIVRRAAHLAELLRAARFAEAPTQERIADLRAQLDGLAGMFPARAFPHLGLLGFRLPGLKAVMPARGTAPEHLVDFGPMLMLLGYGVNFAASVGVCDFIRVVPLRPAYYEARARVTRDAVAALREQLERVPGPAWPARSQWVMYDRPWHPYAADLVCYGRAGTQIFRLIEQAELFEAARLAATVLRTAPMADTEVSYPIRDFGNFDPVDPRGAQVAYRSTPDDNEDDE